jgi:hypothetical protein
MRGGPQAQSQGIRKLESSISLYVVRGNSGRSLEYLIIFVYRVGGLADILVSCTAILSVGLACKRQSKLPKLQARWVSSLIGVENLWK